ncbi:GNAT family N-acetyltransferase [Pyrococcus kukulkanii]|uniref:GNAT family N-acetyltransferase n=1 Tax=Pyrococcus kukulkanii TaxID=1609559 RepID=UPI003564DF8A
MIREANLDDTMGIVKCHLSDVDIPEYPRLSVFDRYKYGGPWMSVETCSIHLNYMFLHNQPVLVAEIGNEVVGELELLIEEEMFLKKLRKVCNADVLIVHRDFRRKGIGKALMQKAEEFAKAKGCDVILVSPEDRSYGFYKRLGYKKLLENYVVKISTGNFDPEDAKLCSFSGEKVKRLELVAGRFQSSYHHWFSSFVNLIADIDKILEVGRLGKSYYVIRELPNGFGGIYVWGHEKDIPGILGRAKKYFSEVITAISRDLIEELEAEILRRNIILGKWIS